MVESLKPLPSSIDTTKCSTKTLCLKVKGASTNWDGDKVTGGPLWDRKIFQVGDFDYTVKDATESFVGLTALGGIIAVICMYVAYRKKEKIKAAAKIAGESVRRGSVSLGRSLSQGSQQLGSSIRRHSVKLHKAMITGSKNKTVPAIEGDDAGEASSSSSDFEKRQERIKAEQAKTKTRKFRKTWRGHEDSILDKVRKTKEGFFKDQNKVPDSARNMLDVEKVDSTRDAFQIDGTQDGIDMKHLEDDKSDHDIAKTEMESPQ